MKTSISITSNVVVSSASQPGFRAVRDGDFETLALKTGLNGPADHWVVIDH